MSDYDLNAGVYRVSKTEMNLIFRPIFSATLLAAVAFSGHCFGQQTCVTYKLIPQTTYQTQPVTVSRLVNETSYQPQQVTTYKPVWTTETRQRTRVSYKPITKTSERVDRYLVRRPITETSYRERQIQETTYETVTEMREQRYLVEKPVVETQMREEKILVRKPVTTTVMQTENVTTLKPVTVTETQYIQGANIGNELVLQKGRNRLRRVPAGCYIDPLTGQLRYKSGGLRWVPEQNLVLRSTIQPTLIPQQVSRTSYQPETVQVQKPVQVTQYVDQVETRQVPVQVSKTSQSIQVIKIPVTVQKPVTRIRTERVPFSEVKYREEIYERRVPVTETSYQRVETTEPYQVQVCKWVAENNTIQVPTTVTRRVNYSVNQVVPQTQWIQVPVDAWGSVIAVPNVNSTAIEPYRISDSISSIPVRRTVLPTPSTSSVDNATTTVVGKPTIRKLSDEEFNELQNRLEPSSILVPETETNPAKPETETSEIVRGGNQNSESAEPADKAPSIGDVPSAEPPSNRVDLELDDNSDIGSRPEQTERKPLRLDDAA